ncbi:MAG: glycosyltransferase family 1 protein [Desulfobacteraceae bacterium]|nr:MAG: glycosyltransferase family 1 protein [Desulfobacteraceae bacterium]
MLYPTPEREAFETGIPYIMAVHDVAHRLLPHFPEFTADGVLNQREYVYTEGIKNACFILADSESGKEQVRTFYDVDPGRIPVLPFVPPFYILDESVKKHEEEWGVLKKGLPSRYLLYPAQLWPHKNHEGLIRAIALIKKTHGIKVPAVFTGAEGDSENLDRLRALGSSLGVQDQITWMGYLASPLMRFLYGEALAMVMPTFLGPTNLPILEAFATGCPVIASDIPGARELVGDAAILIDPGNPEEIASSILRLLSDENLRGMLVRRGILRTADRTPQAFSSKLWSLIDQLKPRPASGVETTRSCGSNESFGEPSRYPDAQAVVARGK